MTAPRKSPTTPPDSAKLHEAALLYLARFAATEASLLRVLQRRIERWAREAAPMQPDPDAVATQRLAALAAAKEVVGRLAAAGAVDDSQFASARAQRLHREGRSRRAIAAHLAARGIERDTANAALPEDDLTAALVFARRRRIGPFCSGAASDDAERHRVLGMLARAGFTRSVASTLLQMTRDAAEDMIVASRK